MSVEIESLNLIDCEFQMFYSQKTKLRSMENLGSRDSVNGMR